MEFAFGPELEELRAEVDKVAADAVATYGRHDDAWINGYSREFSLELGRRGWLGMTWPAEWGGGRTPLERFVVTETLLLRGAPVAATWFADRQMGPTLLAYGTEEQKRRFLPEIRAGEVTWCIGMSEPEAGSDLASLRTRAVRDGDTYVVNGQKIWTSFAAKADYCYLICRTSTEGPPHAGISELIVDLRTTEGITIRPIRDAIGNEHFCEVFFEDVQVPAEHLVGVEGGSWKQTMRQLEHERGGIDRLVSNRRLYEAARAAADTSDPVVRDELARLETGYRLGRLLVLREVLGQAPRSFSAATKTFCTEHEQRVAQFASRVLGAEALLWDGIGPAWAYHPAYTIMGGTSSILRNVIAERLLGLPR